jgi:phosphoglycolate phosphatase-like HAD superfamily hydrolase
LRSRPLALDLDGTLVDARPRQVAALFGQPRPEVLESLDPEAFWTLKRDGMSTRAALGRLGVGAEAAAGLAERWVEMVEGPDLLGLDRPLPGTMEFLEGLAAAGDRPWVLTARRHPDRVSDQFAGLGLEGLCAGLAVVSPAAAAEQKAERLIGLGCRAMVGDTESDGRAAELVGIPFAAVTSGQRSPERLRAAGFETFDTLADATSYLHRCHTAEQ